MHWIVGIQSGVCMLDSIRCQERIKLIGAKLTPIVAYYDLRDPINMKYII